MSKLNTIVSPKGNSRKANRNKLLSFVKQWTKAEAAALRHKEALSAARRRK